MSAPPADPSAAVAMVLAADLGCALCRKRTGEAGTRLCQACGLPVHLSCAQHVAARECALEFGFPLASVFCSKRCFDAAGGDLLGGAAAAATSGDHVEDLAMGKRWSPQVPNEVTAALTLKIGDVTRTSRKHLSITTFRFLLTEGFDVFKAKVNSRAAKVLQSHTLEAFVREDAAIYMRPGVHSKQAELVELSDKNFETRVRKTFRNFLKRKATQSAGGVGGAEQFECDVYVYVKKESAAARRRGRDPHGAATGAGIAATDAAAPATARGGGGVKMLSGLAAQHHLMIQQQQQQQLQHQLRVQPNGDVVDVADGTSAVSELSGGAAMAGTKRHLSELSDETTPPGYKTVRMILNGAVVPVKVNVGDLLAALGLPATALHALQGPQSDHEGGGVASGSSLNGDC